MGLHAGLRLGPYEIVAAIGAGGMGEVYRARDTRLARDVAIKVLPPSFADDRARLDRFTREARTAGALNHPNILTIFDVGVHEGAPYLVSELLDGRTLQARMAAGPLRAADVVDYARQIASGLAAVHAKGITHRDIKPANLFLTTNGVVKILDFGIARQAAAPDDEMTRSGVATQVGSVVGSVGYMAPEQVLGQPVDGRADIFSFGAVLYEMLSRHRAFEGETTIETMNAIVAAHPQDIAEAAPATPPGLQAVVRRTLQKAPDQRFQSASDLAFAIETLGALAGPPPDAIRRRGRIGRAYVLGAIALAAAGGLAGWLAHRPSPPALTAYTRITLQPYTVFNARFASDGQTVVYSAAPQGNRPELFVRRRGAPEGQPVGLRDTELLAVSSRNELALLTNARFIAHRWFIGTLARADMDGTAPRDILDDVSDADWTPDGTQLAIIHTVAGRQRIEFPIGSVLYATSGRVSDLRFSPAGDRLAFMEHPAGVDDRGSVAVVDLHGHTNVLTQESPGEEGLAWAPGGREIYFSGAADEPLPRLTIQAVDLSGRRRNVLQTPDYLTIYDASATGQFLVMQGEEYYKLLGRGSAPGATPADLSWLDESAFATVSRDGRQVLFSEFSFVPNYAVGLRRTDGSPVVRLGDGRACDLSSDGKWALAYIPTSPMHLVLYPTGTGQPRNLDRGPVVGYTSVRFFPDAKRIVSCGNEIQHAERCYVQDVAGGAPVPITPDGTRAALPSPDGEAVLARDTDGRYVEYPVKGGTPVPLPELSPDETVVGWADDGQSVVAARLAEIPSPVSKIDLRTGVRTPLLELAPADRTGVVILLSLSFSQDYKAYAYSYEWLPTRLALVTGAR